MNVHRPKLSPPRVSVSSVADSPRLAKVPLRVLSEHECPFFPDRRATMRGVYALKKYARHYADLLEQGYWRRTDLIEKPICRDCKACRSVRVPVEDFRRTAGHERCWRRNRDVAVEVVDYAADSESMNLFRDDLINRHGWEQKAEDGKQLDDLIDWYAQRLGRSPVKCRAFKYRVEGRLVGLSVCDDLKGALYSAIFAWDVTHARRGLGNFSVLYELEWCRAAGKSHYYLANLIEGFAAADYKLSFRPHEVRGDDGRWHRAD
jgi:leucyl-tRNA---protein transferase